MKKQKLIVAASVAVIVGVASAMLATTVLGTPGPTPPQDPAGLARKGPIVKIAGYPGLAKYGAFVEKTANGMACLVDAPSDRPDRGGGGCNQAADPLDGKAMLTVFSFEGGPRLATVSEARVIGLVRSDVAKVVLLMSDGSARQAPLVEAPTRSVLDADYRVFAHVFGRGETRAGVAPSAVVAYDGTGRELQRNDIGSDLTP